MRTSVVWSLAAVLSLAAAALPGRGEAQDGVASSKAASPGMIELQSAQQLQAVVSNQLKRTQVALDKIGEKGAAPELDNAIQMQKSARERSGAALNVERTRAEGLKTAAAEQKKKADAAGDEAEREKASAAERDAKNLLAKVEAMEKLHKAQGELEQAMVPLKETLAKREESKKTLTGLLKKASEIDDMMLAVLK